MISKRNCRKRGRNERNPSFPDPLDQAELETWRNKADELAQVELELKAARTECETRAR